MIKNSIVCPIFYVQVTMGSCDLHVIILLSSRQKVRDALLVCPNMRPIFMYLATMDNSHNTKIL